MISAALSTLLVLSASYAPAALGQTAANTTTSSSSTASTSSALGLASDLSSGCQAAAGGLLTSDFGACSNIVGLVSVIGASGSILTPLTNWVSGVCSATPCTTDTLKQANQTVSTGCSSDIQKNSVIAVALQTIVSNYNGARDMLCTQYTANSTFCVPSILGNIQTASGSNITINEIVSLVSGNVTPAGKAFANVPSGTYCNDCGHALATQSAAFLAAANGGNSTTNSSATSAISTTCGASFADGKIPSTVRIAGQSAAKKNSSGVRIAGSLVLAVPVALASFSLALFV